MARKKLLIKRGESAGLPTLDYGELAYTRDTQAFYIGTPTGNVQLNTGLTANQQTLLEFWNGTFLESFDATVTSDGATITMSLEQTGGGDLTMVFNDGFTTLDCTPAATISLTAGSDTSPQENFIYIPQSTKVLTKATDDWPSGEHIRVAKFIVQSAGTVQTDGALFNQNWNDHAKGTDSQGHLTHMGQKIRDFGGTWRDGVAPTITINTNVGTPDDVDISTTSGRIFQMHLQTYPARDTSTGDPVHVVNDSASAWTQVTDLEDLLTDNTGASMSGKYFNLVFWGIINKTGETQVMCCNLPGGSYVKESDALNDVSGYDVYTIPAAFKNNGFLILRVTFQHSTASGGTWTSIREDDLRGTLPAVQAEGGVGASQTEFSDNTFKIFDESDATKELQFQVSGVSASTTRTLTVPDENGTIITNQGGTMVGQLMIDGGADEIQLLVQGNGTQTANIFEVETSAATNIFTVSTTALQMGLAADHNIVVNSSGITGDVGGATTLFFFSSSTSYVGNTGSLHAEMDASNFLIMDQANNMFGISSGGAAKVYGYSDVVQLTVTGNAAQTANYFVVENSGGTDLVWVNASGGMEIDGSADTAQLTIQANATQTGATVIVENSSATAKVSLWDTGKIILTGDNDAGTLVTGSQTVTGTGSVTYSLIGGTFAASSTSGSSALAGMTPIMLAANASGTFSAVYGIGNALYGRTSGAGTVTDVYGVRLQPFASGGGTITNLYGVYIDSPVGSGITNHYGLYIEPVASGGSFNRAIFVQSGISEFSDQVFIDGSSDTTQLLVQANGTQTNPIFTIENSGGTNIVTVDYDSGDTAAVVRMGRMSSVPGTDFILGVGRTFNHSSGTEYLMDVYGVYQGTVGTEVIRGLRVGLAMQHSTGTSSTQVIAIEAYPRQISGTSTTTSLTGIYSHVDSAVASGTVGTAIAFRAGTPIATGNLTNSYGITVDTQNAASSLAYGLYIAPITGASSNYAIYTENGAVLFGDRAVIDGTQDAIQLRIQANATQTQDIFVVENSGGTDLVYVDKEGRFLVGGNVGTQTLTLSHHKWTAALTTGSSYFAMQAQIYDTSANSASNTGFRGNAYSGHTSGTIGNTVGVASLAYAAGSGGTTTNLFGFRTDSDVASGATVSVRAGMYIANTTGSGTLTTQYGIYMTSMTTGTSNYALYTGTGLVYVQDQLTVAGTQDIVQTRIYANGTQTNAILIVYDSSATAGLVVYDDKTEIYGGGASTYHKLGVKWTDVASASGSYYCMDMAIYNTTAGSAALIGARGIVFANSTGALTGSHTGFIGSVYQNAAGGSVSGAYGVRAQIVANNATGTISNAYGFQCDSFTATGTITNAYGFYCGSITAGATLNYAWFSGQGLAEFNDQIYIDGSQDVIQLKVHANGTQTNDLAYFSSSAGTQYVAIGGSGGIEVGVPTGGNKGNGTINTAGDIYKNNSAYTNPDYALEFWIKDGIIEVHKDKPGAVGYYRMSLDELGEYIKKHFRLPRMDDKPMGIFDRADRMLEKVEELTTYILELHERIKVLEEKLEAKQ